MAEIRTWSVPGFDPAAECWVGWSMKLNGYYLAMRTPEDPTFCSDAFACVPALMVGTAGAIMWDEVPASVLAELEHAPTAAFLEAEHTSRHERAVASTLRVALAS